MASISSRIFRAPRSAQIAEPPAPAISSAVTIGLASRRTASTEAAPVNDWAPSCRVSEPSCRAITAPNGMATSAVGRIVTLAMNQDCWMNSRSWNGRLGSALTTSSANAKRLPLAASGRVGENLPSSSPGAFGLSVAVTPHPPAGQRGGGAATGGAGGVGLGRPVPAARAPGGLEGTGVRLGQQVLGEGGADRLGGVGVELVQHAGDPLLPAARALALGQALGGLQLRRDGVPTARALRADAVVRVAATGLQGGHLGLDLGDVLLLAHPDRALAPAVQELADDGLLGGEQLLARPEHDEVAAEEQAQVVRHRARRADVVGDDQERRVDLGVQVDDELVEVGDADRVEAGVRLVEQDDLGVEHQGAGQAGALAHTAGDLAGELPLGTLETDHLHLLEDDPLDLRLALLRVLAQREGDVVEEVHRAEEGAVLEEDAEELADLVELVLAGLDDVGVVEDDRAPLRLQQADERLQEHRLAGTRGAEEHRDLPRRQRERDIAPDVLAAEGFRQTLDLDCDAHDRLALRSGFIAGSPPRRVDEPRHVRRRGRIRIRTPTSRFY